MAAEGGSGSLNYALYGGRGIFSIQPATGDIRLERPLPGLACPSNIPDKDEKDLQMGRINFA